MDRQELFRQNLPLVDRISERIARRVGVYGADAEDLASSVRIALIEDDYAILGKFEGRSALPTFLTIVIQRLILNEQTRVRGKWHASAEAERAGPAAVLAERLIRRDGRAPAEAVPIVRAMHPELAPEEIEAMIAGLPQRAPRPRLVDLEAPGRPLAASDRTDARVLAAETRRISTRASEVVCRVLGSMTLSDRMLLRLRFGSAMSIADVARVMNAPQRPLYRRLEALLARLRSELTAAGIDARIATDLIGDAAHELDFGLGDGKAAAEGRSNTEAGEHA